MAERRQVLVVGLVLVFVAGLLAAQQTSSSSSSGSSSASSSKAATKTNGKDLTIEQLYLSQSVEMQVLRDQAHSDKRSTQQLALQTIQSMVQNGSLAHANPAVGPVLATLATEGLSHQVREGNTIANDFPDVRREACYLLGDFGGDVAKKALVTVLEQDNEPMVLAEAVYALGRIGLNKDNDVTNRIVWLLNRESDKRSPDNNLAFACLLALQKLSEKVGGASSPNIIDAMLNVASGNYIQDVRLKAIDTIYQIRKLQKQG